MPLKIDYRCFNCGHFTNNRVMESMICKCGGDYRPEGVNYKNQVSKFEPHYCPTLKKYLTSWSHQEKEARKFRSKEHPEGFVLVQDNKKFLKQCKEIVKNKEEIIEKQYAEDGIKYKKGSNTNFDDNKGCFVDRNTKAPVGSKVKAKSKATRISDKIKHVAAALLILLMTSPNASATDLKDVEGLRWFDITVDGKTYSVPEHKDNFYGDNVTIWLRAIDGDKYARKYLLGGKEKAILFMGDGTNMNRWLHLTMDKVWVVE